MSAPRRWTRRDLLRLAGGGLLLPLAARAPAQEPPGPTPSPSPSPSPSPPPFSLPLLPRVNGGINLQPLRRYDTDPDPSLPVIVPELVDAQMRAVYELGFEQLRITISFNRFGPDFLAAIPYVRAARALGIDVVGIMADFAGLDLAQALARRATREEVVGAYVALFDGPIAPANSAVARTGAMALQVLNEPTHFLGLTPESYVREFLGPTYAAIKAKAPDLTVVSAAEVGNVDGYLRARAMLQAGMERSCDRIAFHVYSRKLIPLLAGLAQRPVWITESGAEGTENHLAWVRDTFAEMRRTIPQVERIFYFLLFDFGARRFRILDIVPDPAGGFAIVVESTALHEHFASRVRDATGGRPHARYEDLVPDITVYFPTAADLALIASTSYGRR